MRTGKQICQIRQRAASCGRAFVSPVPLREVPVPTRRSADCDWLQRPWQGSHSIDAVGKYGCIPEMAAWSHIKACQHNGLCAAFLYSKLLRDTAAAAFFSDGVQWLPLANLLPSVLVRGPGLPSPEPFALLMPTTTLVLLLNCHHRLCHLHPLSHHLQPTTKIRKG